MEISGPAFSQLLDRGIAAEGLLAKWCPTMDLLALVTADGQLHMHRLNWQRLWWTSPDCPITALEWRPDGKQLAVGLEDGGVLLLNTEDGEVQHKAQLVPGSALVAISWTQAAAPGDGCAEPATVSGQLAGDRARRMFAPPPPPLPSAATGLSVGYSTCGQHGTGGQAWPQEVARLAVLACASADGSLVLCTSRLFRLAQVQLRGLLGCEGLRVHHLATAASLAELAVCWRAGAAGTASPLRLSRVGTRHVGRQADQLHHLATAAAHIEALLEGCQQSLRHALQDWRKGMHDCDGSRAALAGLMHDWGTSGDPAGELRGLLATGAVGGALQQYVTSTLGEAGLKRVSRAVDAAVCSVHNLLTDHLQPQLEQLAFRLGDLRGLALCLPWRRVTGLQPNQVAITEATALRLVLRAEAVRRRVVAAGAQYRSFFAWLLVVLRRMGDDASDVLVGYPRSQLESVADFLAGQYGRDAVEPMLGGGGGGDSEAPGGGCDDGLPAAAGAAGGSMVELALDVLGRHGAAQAADSTAAGSPGGSSDAAAGGCGTDDGEASLAQLLGSLQAACSAAFGCTSQLVSPSLSLIGGLRLGPAPSALAVTYLQAGATAAAVGWEAQPSVLLLRGGTPGGGGGAEQEGAWEAAVVQLPGGEALADLAFYRDGQLALLLAPAGGAPGGCRLLLLPQPLLHFVRLPAELLADSDALQLCQMLAEGGGGGAVVPDGCRQRLLPYPRVQAPLAVSASRGVGCVLAGTQRVVLLDLEEDEAEEEEGAEEGEGQGLDGSGSGSAIFDSPPL